MTQSDIPNISHNTPELSVSDLALGIKRELEQAFGQVRVRGELSKIKLHTSGHLYSDLKDENAVINLICWRTTLPKLNVRPEEGLEVICTGRITTYPARSNYQLVVESMELAGQGALLKMLADRKLRLEKEGLFDPSRKQDIPFLPRVIGVVTSPTGAVIKDILHRLADRCPAHVIVWPVRVQGEGCADEVAAAINGFASLPENGPTPRPDVLIVARGGGSQEDLMPFNEESVVRAAANCPIPLISAVGHETDTTLIDYAADRRAPTPTAAAEMAVPRRDDLLFTLQERGMQMAHGLRRMVREHEARLAAASAPLRRPERLYDMKAQALDALSSRLPLALQTRVNAAGHAVAVLAGKLRHPRDIIVTNTDRVTTLADRLHAGVLRSIAQETRHLEQISRLLNSYSVETTLARGFAVVRDADGHIVTDPDPIAAGVDVSLTFAQGKQRKATLK
jgi:exodeoxyribonuclease VII large subunit